MTEDLPRSPKAVRDTYDRIAEHFSETRYAPWPEVEPFVNSLDTGGVGLDVGCGNGRHLPVLLGRVDSAVGLDTSRELLREAANRADLESTSVALLQADAANLPFPDESIDVALSVATVHHLPDRDSRVQSMVEIRRVLNPDGRALVSAWSTAHDRFEASATDEEGFDTSVDWTLPSGETVPRFYHIYAPAEFEADLERAGLRIEDSYVSSGNCYAEVRP